MRLSLLCSLLLGWSTMTSARAVEAWEEALAQMPLRHPVAELNRTNCVRTVLESLGSNPVVKAVIFLPGATDEFYFFRRASARLSGANPTLLDAVRALTSETNLRATFKPPFLLLHTSEETTEPRIRINDPARVEKLRSRRFQDHTYFDDRDWDHVQPLLRDRIRVDLRPWRYSHDSWHFYRHSYAGWNLNCWEAIQANSLAGGTQVQINRSQVIFAGPPRATPADAPPK